MLGSHPTPLLLAAKASRCWLSFSYTKHSATVPTIHNQKQAPLKHIMMRLVLLYQTAIVLAGSLYSFA
jgi:hypothetical protein